ncbi:MAG: metallophosphoesterase [Solirubrobacterales bacterium]|nr:metallophosphoesterase [Solirubrobacterales bacterium]
MRTLVVSDLHLGARGELDVLRVPANRERLVAALTGADRLVLLGDVIELRQGPARDALAAAAPTLRALGTGLATGARVTLVPGNHDHGLLAPWLNRRGRDAPPPPLGLQTAAEARDDEPLARIVEWLGQGGAEVEVAYPGSWLRPDVYAMHGHYSDRHCTVPMLERLGAGAMARIAAPAPAGPRRAEDYEAVLGPMYAWMDALAQADAAPRRSGTAGASASAWRALAGAGGRRGPRRRAVAAAFPAIVAILRALGLGPLSADLSPDALRRARLQAIGEVVSRLGVVAAHVIVGHTHRAGPLPGDDLGEWRVGTMLTNCGCWVRDPAFAGVEPGSSPYRPGFAAIVGEESPPALVNLLDPPGPGRSTPRGS